MGRAEVAATWPCYRFDFGHFGSVDFLHKCAELQEDLIDVMPAVEEANSISEELDKRVKFEIILIRLVDLQNFRWQSQKEGGRCPPGSRLLHNLL